MKLETNVLQNICDQISIEIDAIVTIIGSRGKIIGNCSSQVLSGVM
jgi:hypothetical protein